MDVRLTADEATCVKKLAERFEKNEIWVMVDSVSTRENGCVVDSLGLPPEKREAILGVMAEMGLLAKIDHAIGLRFFRFCITAKALQAARAIHEQETQKEEPTDMVEKLRAKAKSNPVTAWAIIIFLALVAFVAGANQTLDLLAKFGIPVQKAAPIGPPAPIVPRTNESPASPEK